MGKISIIIVIALMFSFLTKTWAQFAKGADVGYMLCMEKQGYTWKNSSGKQQDLLVTLKEKNINSIRIRTWVNPDPNYDHGCVSQDESIALAVRCKKLGLRVMIDFHYGDIWNSIGTQNPPAAWAKMSYTQMQTALYNYVYNFCIALKAAGVTPEWIQNGNEINSGICLPVGSSTGHPTQMTGLLNQGYAAMKKVFPNVKVIIHVAGPQNTSAMALLDTYKANGGKWDVTGLSSYSSSVLASNVEAIKAKHTQEIMMVEIGAEKSNVGKAKSLVENWIKELDKINNPCEGGVFYWEPAVYEPFSARTNTAWDATTRQPLATMDGFAVATKNCTITALDETYEPASLITTSCFPNPFSSDFQIKTEGNFLYTIYDLAGNKLEEGQGQNNLNVGGELQSGIYLVNVHHSQGNDFLKITKK